MTANYEKKQTHRDRYWEEYVNDKLTRHCLSLVDPVELASEDIQDIAELGPKDGTKLLRSYIGESEANKFSERFRAHKYRKSNDKKTIVVSNKVKTLLESLVDITHAETFEEALDYVVSPKYTAERKQMVEAVSDQDYTLENVNIHKFAERLTLRDQRRLLRCFEIIYQDAWRTAKSTRSRKKSIVNDAMSEHPLIKLLAEVESGKL